MAYVYFVYQPGGLRAGAGSSHTPYSSKRKHFVQGTGETRLDTRSPGKNADQSTISLYFSTTYYKWVLEMSGMAPQPLNGIFYTSKDLPGGAIQTNRY